MIIPRAVIAPCVSAVFAAGLAFSAAAQDADYVRSLAATCFTCHGTDGRSVDGIPPSIAGGNKAYLLQQMKDFKSGKRSSTVMGQQAKGYTDEQLELIAGYFASQKAGSGAPAPRAAN